MKFEKEYILRKEHQNNIKERTQINDQLQKTIPIYPRKEEHDLLDYSDSVWPLIFLNAALLIGMFVIL